MSSITGCYFNVMGFPVHKFAKVVSEMIDEGKIRPERDVRGGRDRPSRGGAVTSRAAGVGARAFSFVAVHFFLVSDFGGGGNLRVSATDAAVRFIVDLSISNAWSSLL